MAMTPYPYDTNTYENPSIVVSEDGLTWSTPEGLINPIVPEPPCDHNNDADMVYNPLTDELDLYYVELMRPDHCGGARNENNIRLVTSPDGLTWSAPRTVMSWPGDSSPLYLSPSVVCADGQFKMWIANNTSGVGYATSADGVTWSSVQTIEVTPAPWHLDVTYVDGQYVMLIVDSPVSGARLVEATSRDGLNWSAVPVPLLTPGSGWDSDRVYRSALVCVDATNTFQLWYSARSTAGQWHIGYAEAKR
jgi:hypothetical protein